MLIIFADHPDFGEIAHARFKERKRILSIANSIVSTFPERYNGNRKKYKIAIQVCHELSKEIDEKFRLI